MPGNVLLDTALGCIYVASATVYTITPEIAKRQNVTGTFGFVEHPFEHPFMIMLFQFLVQACCLPLWYFVTGGQRANQNNQNNDQPLGAPVNPVRYDDVMIANGNPVNPNIVNAGNIQDNIGDQVGDGDDPLINANGEPEEPQPVRPRREPIIPNNPAWNERPVDQTIFNPFLFLAPAMFDLSRYGLLYIAIRLTYDSSFMMIRSASVIFTVLLRVAFLSKHMAKYMWVSISMVVAGLGLIGMTDYVHNRPPGFDDYGLAAGDLLIAMSQIMIAMQFVFEEKFMDKHSIDPLKVVGMQGCYASLGSLILIIVFTYVPSGPFSTLPDSHIVDLKDAFLQMRSSPIVAVCVVGAVFSKVIYFYCGTKLVKNRRDSCMRITIDVHHDLIIWGVSLGLGWQKYFWPQIIGYIFVPIGMLVYNDIMPLPKACLPPEVPRPVQGPLPEEAINMDGGRMPGDEGPEGDDELLQLPPENVIGGEGQGGHDD